MSTQQWWPCSDADINAPSASGILPLETALKKENLATADRLVKLNANVDVQTNSASECTSFTVFLIWVVCCVGASSSSNTVIPSSIVFSFAYWVSVLYLVCLFESHHVVFTWILKLLTSGSPRSSDDLVRFPCTTVLGLSSVIWTLTSLFGAHMMRAVSGRITAAAVCSNWQRTGGDFPLATQHQQGGNFLDIIRKRIKYVCGQVCNDQGYNALDVACMNGHNNVLQKLLEYKCKSFFRDEDGNSILHQACYEGDESKVQSCWHECVLSCVWVVGRVGNGCSWRYNEL